MLSESSHCIFLSVKFIDSVFKIGNILKCYPQVFLEEFKYTVKVKRVSKFICVLENSHHISDGENTNK